MNRCILSVFMDLMALCICVTICGQVVVLDSGVQSQLANFYL